MNGEHVISSGRPHRGVRVSLRSIGVRHLILGGALVVGVGWNACCLVQSRHVIQLEEVREIYCVYHSPAFPERAVHLRIRSTGDASAPFETKLAMLSELRDGTLHPSVHGIPLSRHAIEKLVDLFNRFHVWHWGTAQPKERYDDHWEITISLDRGHTGVVKEIRGNISAALPSCAFYSPQEQLAEELEGLVPRSNYY